MFGRFKRRLHALMTSGKPTVRKFLQAFEGGFLVLPELDAYRRVGQAVAGCKMFGTKVTLSAIVVIRWS
jgi:hypothetical protein